MSISITNTLYQQYPAYHKGLWAFDSNNKDQVGFQYIIDVYSGENNVFITRFQPPPRPGDGYGLFNAAVLRTKIDQSKDVYETMVGWKPAPNSSVKYKLVVGEKVDQWSFTDNYFASGNLGFTSLTQAHSFITGDQILVFQDSPFTNQSYEGFATVISVPSDHSIVVNKPFAGSGPVEGGTIRRSDGTSMIVSGLTTGQTSWVIGYTLDDEDLEAYDVDEYSPGVTAGNKRLLTDMPDEFTMRADARLMLSVPQFSGSVGACIIKTYDKNNVSLGMYSISMAGALLSTKRMLYVSVGPYDVDNENPTVLSGTSEPINADLAYYDFYLFSTASTQCSESKRIWVDQDCAEQEYNLLFMDKKGTFNTFSFLNKETIDFENKKQTFMYDGKGSIGQSGAGGFTHDTASRGYTVFDSRQIKKITVRSKDMTEEESEYFMQLLSSPICYWMKSPEVWFPIVINDYTISQQQFENDKFIEYEIQFSLGSNERINW